MGFVGTTTHETTGQPHVGKKPKKKKDEKNSNTKKKTC